MAAKASQGRRLALIIAGSTYSDPSLQQLRAPGRDASDLAEVLADRAIGGFEVDTLVDAPGEQVRSEIFDFCDQARPGDLLLLYLSCHGVLDDRGRLYYAATDTQRRRLGLTGIPSEWLNEQLEDCKARREILILDCCHSGAFAKGSKGPTSLALQEKFGGRGKAVLTASRATEYSFEGEAAVGDAVRSVFTHAIVQGLRSGAADRDKDGLVTVEDLYHYVYEMVRQAEPRQTPEWWVSNGEGEFVVARSVRGAIVAPVALSKHVTEILESPHVEVRESGVKVLARLLEQGSPERGPTDRQKGLALSARQRLQQIVEEDLPRVAVQARAAISAGSGESTADPESAPQDSTEILSESPSRGATEPTVGNPPTSYPSWAGDQPGPQQVADLSVDLSARQADGPPQMAQDNLQGARDTSATLEQAKQHVTETRVADLQHQLHVAAEAQKWQRVLDLSRELATLDQAAADPDGLATHALAAIHPARNVNQIPQPGVRAANKEGEAPTAYRIGDKVNGYVLGTDNVWHPLTRRRQPPQHGTWKRYFGV